MIFSSKCDNPEGGYVLVIPETGETFSEDDCWAMKKVCDPKLGCVTKHYLKKGYNVLTIEECNEIMEERRVS